MDLMRGQVGVGFGGSAARAAGMGSARVGRL